MNHDNPELLLAEAFVEETDCPIFLTGKAGTGKTTFLQQLAGRTGKRLIVTAPTGVAAINAGGVTLHSFFQLPFGPMVPADTSFFARHRFSRDKRNIVRSLDLLVIDEISMVRADLLDGVDTVLRRYRGNDQPFGGVQLLMIGDLHQLAPVVREVEWQLLRPHYASPWFFASLALQRTGMVPVELLRVYRQDDDRFVDLLNRIRSGYVDEVTLEELNSRYQPDFVPDEGCITLCTHNSRADAVNRARMNELPGSNYRFSAAIDGDFPEYAFPTAAELDLKEGAQVLFVRNDTAPEKRWYNGKIGTVTNISARGVEVRCPGEDERILVEKVDWENLAYTVDPETTEITSKVVGSFSQYPLRPAWAITIHKSQGLTFDRAVIDAEAAFAFGQVYVALSRCRTFSGLVLRSPIPPQAVRTDPAVLDFNAALADQQPDAATLEAARIRFQQRLLLDCFDFRRLEQQLGRLVGLTRSHAAVIRLSAGADLAEEAQLAVEAVCRVGERFANQLRGLFAADTLPAANPVIGERLASAADYFLEQFDTLLTPCLADLAVESDNREVERRITEAIRQARQESLVKQAGVLACGAGFSPATYLRAVSAAGFEAEKRVRKATVTYTEADVGHPELYEQLREWRTARARKDGLPPFQVLHQKTLVQIAVHLPATPDDLFSIKGIGPRLLERYGAELVGLVVAYRSRHAIDTVDLPTPGAIGPTGERKKGSQRVNTKEISLEMLRSGKTMEEIAGERELTLQTVTGHLAWYVKRGELEVTAVLSEERLRHLEAQIEATGVRPLAALKEALGEGYSYGEINLVLAHREWAAGQG
ncbi:MAG: helix-turn-helix domain-containing protein [Desulfobulbus sp.]|jgi:hypothetical protein|nr:helix-turn-helix domain-containing protein [Desulfobulbus sp.]